MSTNNRFIVGIAHWFLRNKVRRFGFSYEKEVYETDVVDQTYVRQYIDELKAAIEKEVAYLTKEYNL
jgi:hypothetical protein